MSAPAPSSAAGAPDARGTVLFVDDEPNVLSALRRVFRSGRYRVLTAAGGGDALALLEAEAVDVLVSDMRMPGMDGAQLLAQVAERWPSVRRLLLTGYADMESAVAAINQGHIYGYFSKPWEEAGLRLGVENALRDKRMEEQQQRLTEELAAKNRELLALNASLDTQVHVRTAQLQTAMSNIQTTHQTLKRHFSETVRAFAKLVDQREGQPSGHARRIAEQAGKLAQDLGLPERERQDVVFAGLLLQVGKVTLRDKLVLRPFNSLFKVERENYMRHAAVGASVLSKIGPLAPASQLVAVQFECFDGSGFPNGLVGDQIPMGGRILSALRDYDLMLEGALTGKAMTASEAQDQLRRLRGKKYDPRVVDALLARVGEVQDTRYRPVVDAGLVDLAPGMEIVEVAGAGNVYLRDLVLTDELLRELYDLERDVGSALVIRVRARK